MITEIGIIAGKILELLERRNGVLVFGEIHSELNHPRDRVLMALGWLLNERYVYVMEDPATTAYLDQERNKGLMGNPGVFDLIITKKVLIANNKRIKNMSEHIAVVASKILVLLEGCGDLMNLQTIERNLNERRDIVLMGLGWLIREGQVKGISTSYEVLVLRLPKEHASLQMVSYSNV